MVFVVSLVSSLLWLFVLVNAAPPDAGRDLRFPSDMVQLREVSKVLKGLTETMPTYVLLLFSSAYVFKQTFAVPGSVFLNVLAGAVFGLPLGFGLCCALTATGATLCCLLARFCLAEDIPSFMAVHVERLRIRLRENSHRSAYFLLFLRIFPMSPNWAINVSCGALGVPVSTFFGTVLIGLMPYNFICVQTGAILSSISSV